MNKTAKWVGVVTRATLPVRKNPNSKSMTHSYSPLIKGDTVRVCDTSKGWYYIETDGKYGYVNAKYIKFSESVKSAKPSKTVKWIGKTSQSVTLRTSPTAKASKVATLGTMSVVRVCDTINGYWYVWWRGKRGYISARYVTFLRSTTAKTVKVDEFLASVKATQEYARTHNYYWADSQSNVPCADGKISCDRLVARALWDMGYTDQIRGGIALGRDFEGYLVKHGFKRSTSMKDAKPGSVFVVMNPSGSSRHVFVIASRSGDRYTRYDCGSTEWIRSKQPLQGLWMSRLIGAYNL